MPEAPSQPSTTPKPADSPASASQPEVDVTKLTSDQLEKVLEHPEFFNISRVKKMRERAAEADKLEAAQTKAENDKLTANKEFEKLAKKTADENTALKQKLQDASINQALTTKLAGEKVIDVDGALKLIDKSKIAIDDNGSVSGIDEALTSLKTDRSYLFTEASSANNKPVVGNPSNPNPTPVNSSGFKFKESQLTPEFYKANKSEIDAAGVQGLIEADGPPTTQ